MANTEKPTTKAEAKKQGIEKKPKKIAEAPIKTPVKKSEEKISKPEEKKSAEDKTETGEKETQDKGKKKTEKKDVPKKTEAIVRGKDIPISTKDSIAACRFIKGKLIKKAVQDFEEILKKKKALPMKGEIPHRKGKMMSGRYPEKVSKNFIVLLKGLAANSNDLDEPVIVEAVANMASRPYGRFGRVKKKRTHILIRAKEKEIVKQGGKK